MRLAHEDERPPEFGTWFCDCRACFVQLRALAANIPSSRIVIKLERAPRVVVSVGEYVEAGTADAFCPHGDCVREVFVADPGPVLVHGFGPLGAQSIPGGSEHFA